MACSRHGPATDGPCPHLRFGGFVSLTRNRLAIHWRDSKTPILWSCASTKAIKEMPIRITIHFAVGLHVKTFESPLTTHPTLNPSSHSITADLSVNARTEE